MENVPNPFSRKAMDILDRIRPADAPLVLVLPDGSQCEVVAGDLMPRTVDTLSVTPLAEL